MYVCMYVCNAQNAHVIGRIVNLTCVQTNEAAFNTPEPGRVIGRIVYYSWAPTSEVTVNTPECKALKKLTPLSRPVSLAELYIPPGPRPTG